MDTKTLRLVILVLGAVALATVVGGMFLTYNDHDIPAALIGIGSSAATAIVALLSRPPTDAPGVAAALAATPPAPPVDLSAVQVALGKVLEEITNVTASPGPTTGTPPPGG